MFPICVSVTLPEFMCWQNIHGKQFSIPYYEIMTGEIWYLFIFPVIITQ